jgi:acyl dehydratase
VILFVGEPLPALVSTPIEPAAMAAMAIVLADPNPIHLDGSIVQSLGLGTRPVVQGPITVGLMLEMLGQALPDAHIDSLEVRYLANAYAGDRVRISGAIDEIEHQPNGQRLRCTLQAVIETDQRPVASARATLSLG